MKEEVDSIEMTAENMDHVVSPLQATQIQSTFKISKIKSCSIIQNLPSNLFKISK